MSGNIFSIILIVLAALGSIIGNTLFRLGLQKAGVQSLSPEYLVKNLLHIVFQPLVFAGFVAFIVSAVVWMRVLSTEPLSKSYPILVSCMVFFLILSSVLFLREPITLAKISGMALIILGTFLVFAKIG